MEAFIVTGVVIIFLLLMLPAVMIPFVNQNPSTVDTVRRPEPGPFRPESGPAPAFSDHPSDRLAA